MEQYQQHDLELDQQPVGASGESLGVMAVMMLKIKIKGTSKSFNVPCYVLQSCKPLWNGELYDCALVLGTNALEALGFHPNGELINATNKSVILQTNQPESNLEDMVHVVLDQKVRLGPFQSNVVKESRINANSNCDTHVGMIVAADKMANM